MIVTVFGTRGSGKSTFIKSTIKKLPRVFLYDTLGEYGTDTVDQIFYTKKELAEFFLTLKKNQFFNISYLPLVPEDDFDWSARVALAVGGVCFVVDEIDLYTKPSYCPPGLRKLIRYGRHYGIDMITASRRPPEVSREITAQTGKFILFRMHEPADQAYIRSVAGVNIATQNLEQFEYYQVEGGRAEKKKLKIWFKVTGEHQGSQAPLIQESGPEAEQEPEDPSQEENPED